MLIPLPEKLYYVNSVSTGILLKIKFEKCLASIYRLIDIQGFGGNTMLFEIILLLYT